MENAGNTTPGDVTAANATTGSSTPNNSKAVRMVERFRGFMPVIVDVETGGFDAEHDALLEIAVVTLGMDEQGYLRPHAAVSTHVEPFPGARIDPRSLEITGIDPDNPLRGALSERLALDHVFAPIRQVMRDVTCQRAVLVGHNAAFDLAFLNAAVRRCGHKRNPFHPFSCFDTATLGGLAYGQTVLSKAVLAAGHVFDSREAHSAVYDAERTAELFCTIVNRWRKLELLEHEYAQRVSNIDIPTAAYAMGAGSSFDVSPLAAAADPSAPKPSP